MHGLQHGLAPIKTGKNVAREGITGASGIYGRHFVGRNIDRTVGAKPSGAPGAERDNDVFDRNVLRALSSRVFKLRGFDFVQD